MGSGRSTMSTKGGVGSAGGATQMGKQLFNEATPVRQELLGQTLEALMTGGVGARIPIIQRAVEQQKAALGQGLRATAENASSIPGIAGTPFLESILAGQRVGGEQAIAGIPSQIAQQMAGGASNLALGFPQIGLQGVLGGAGIQQQAKGQQLGFLSNLFNSSANVAAASALAG